MAVTLLKLREAEGRDVVMLVVADMRFDPRVEREALAFAAGGYSVTVIWPDPLTAAAGQSTPIDWGEGVAFRSLSEHAGAFSWQFPGFLGTAIAPAALARTPSAISTNGVTRTSPGARYGASTRRIRPR